MARKPSDPLASIPAPEVVRKRYQETLELAERLRIMLELSERVYGTKPPEDGEAKPHE